MGLVLNGIKFLGFSVILLGFLYYERKLAIVKSGNLLLRVTRPTVKKWQLIISWLLFFVCLVFILENVISSLLYRDSEFLLGIFSKLLVMGISLLTALPRFGFGPAYLDFRERGLIDWGTRFLSWERAKYYKWTQPTDSMLFIQFDCLMVNYRILPNQKLEVDRILSEVITTTS